MGDENIVMLRCLQYSRDVPHTGSAVTWWSKFVGGERLAEGAFSVPSSVHGSGTTKLRNDRSVFRDFVYVVYLLLN